MASERDFELLDDYIGNRLNGAEKKAFEDKLQGDTELQSEYKIQQNIVETLRKARVAELKAMLKNIPTSSIPADYSSVVRWTSIAGAALVVVALYFYLKPETPSPAPPASDTTAVVEQQPSAPAVEAPATPEVEDQPIQSSSQDKVKDTGKVVERKSTKGSIPAAAPKSPDLDVFDPSEENSTAAKAPDEIAPAMEGTVSPKSDILAEIKSADKNFSFHYQFADGKLVLYGPFDKNIYEILEFISDSKRTIFLFYKNNYYLLNQATEKVKPLTPVNDPVLLQKLKEHRGH
jgi:hypothetical protein